MRFSMPKPLHGWREFVHEITIIVFGVLIALAANELVESWAWNDKVARAEAAMRIELAEDDGPQAYGRVLIGRCLDMQIARIHDGGGHVPAAQLREWVAGYSPPYRTWDTEAWKTVLGSDVGSHVGPERLIQWSSPYRVLNRLTDENSAERDLTAQIREALPPDGVPSASDLQTLRRLSAELRTINASLYKASQLVLFRSQALGAPVPVKMRQEMTNEAHATYGDCARPPDLGARPVAQSLTANLRMAPIRFGN